ncbi:hypothetical protein N431DRAFT_524137 [Stipitochalara longipes BDJ]|nr:hypothetical protein N431DRAFT_524137 [Stipitochalara longipes BDJ]
MHTRASGSIRTKGVVPESTIQGAYDPLELNRNRNPEIQDLVDAALQTRQQLEGLLSLKQQQASIIEAKTAVRQAEENAKQGRAIIAFTLVTIFFLPLGFFVAFFGINDQEVNQSSWMTLDEQIKYMCKSTPSSFGRCDIHIEGYKGQGIQYLARATLTIPVKVPLAFIAEYTGLRHVWNYYVVDHQTLERKGQSQLNYIYKKTEANTGQMVREGI